MPAETTPSDDELHEFGARCAEAGLLVFQCSGNGDIEPLGPVAPGIETFFGSPRLGAAVAARDVRQMPWEPFDLYPGCRAAVARAADECRTPGILLLEPKALSGVPVATTAAIVPFVKYNAAQEAQAVYTFRQLYESSAAARSNQRLVDQFASNLGQAYEELNLFFRLARSLNGTQDPARTIALFCEELRNILPFRWVTAAFFEADARLPGLSDRPFVSGTLPCDERQLLEAARKGAGADGGLWVRISNPPENPLAVLAGGQVVCEPITDGRTVVGALIVGGKQGPDAEVISGELQMIEAAASFVGIFRENVARLARLKSLFVGTVRSLAASIDAKDHYTRGHSERVSLLAATLARALGMDEETVEQYRVTGLLHDVGKIGIPESILTKPGRLSDDEFRQIMNHPRMGYDILKAIPGIAFALPGVLHHHEKFDGTGYPERLAGERIPLIARVLALADTFDAMRSQRSYRSALAHDTVLDTIRRCSGTQFDPELAKVFVALDFGEFDRMLAAESSRAMAA